MIVSELRFKDLMDFAKCDMEWLRDAVVGPDVLYSPEAKKAAKEAQECLMRLMAQADLVKKYVDARDEAFRLILSGAKPDPQQLSLFESET